MLEEALCALKSGEMILLHDYSDRENEIDMVISAKYVTPKHIAQMRQFGGGLVCIAVDDKTSDNLKLEYLHKTLKENMIPEHQKMIYNGTKYGDHPSFSMWINHVDARTGITDYDRALTANDMASLSELNQDHQLSYFSKMFKTPGHMPLLKSASGLLNTRQGHTEMSTHLMRIADLPPVSVVCEMMDPITHKALSMDKATEYAKINNLAIIDAENVLSTQKIRA